MDESLGCVLAMGTDESKVCIFLHNIDWPQWMKLQQTLSSMEKACRLLVISVCFLYIENELSLTPLQKDCQEKRCHNRFINDHFYFGRG